MGTKCCTCAKLCTDEQTKEVSIQKVYIYIYSVYINSI